MKNRKSRKQVKVSLIIFFSILAAIVVILLSRYLKQKQIELTKANPEKTTEILNEEDYETYKAADGIIIKYKQGKEGRINKEIQKYSKEKPINKFERVYTINVSENQIEEAIKEIQESSDVEYAEPDFYYQYFFTPNDPLFERQWWLKKIEAEKSWDITKGEENVKVGILDTGIANNHNDLSSKVLRWENFSGGSPYDTLGHGTMVGGVVSAITNNQTGVSSIGYNVKILSIKVGDKKGVKASEAAKAIRWAGDNKIDIINMSFGSSEKSKTIEEAIEYAWNKGVLIVAAAGNTGKTKPQYPASYPYVISVAATDQNDLKAKFSTYGSWVDISAPGQDILSTTNSGGYSSASGTSLSAPIVAGVAALVKSRFPNYSNEKIEQIICDTADKIQGTGSQWRCGRVNAFKAVSYNSQTTPAPTITPKPTVSPTPTPSNLIRIKLRFQGITKKANKQKVLIELYKDSSILYKDEKIIENDEYGIYNFLIDNTSGKISPGKYSVWAKGESHLGKKFKNIEIKSINETINLTSEDIRAGDVNNDNKIDISDIAQILTYYKTFSNKVDENNQKMVNSDINKDGKITIIDIAIAALNWSSLTTHGE